jgi:hypothetical protein
MHYISQRVREKARVGHERKGEHSLQPILSASMSGIDARRMAAEKSERMAGLYEPHKWYHQPDAGSKCEWYEQTRQRRVTCEAVRRHWSTWSRSELPSHKDTEKERT